MNHLYFEKADEITKKKCELRNSSTYRALIHPFINHWRKKFSSLSESKIIKFFFLYVHWWNVFAFESDFKQNSIRVCHIETTKTFEETIQLFILKNRSTSTKLIWIVFIVQFFNWLQLRSFSVFSTFLICATNTK